MFVKWICSVSTFSRLYKQSARDSSASPRRRRWNAAPSHEVIAPLPKWDGNASTEGIQKHTAAPRRRLRNSNGTKNRASILLTEDLYYSLQKWDQLYGSVGFLWGEKKKKRATRRKYALLTTDLRNALANKKIIWAEQQLRTLINRAGFNWLKGNTCPRSCAREPNYFQPLDCLNRLYK